MTTMAQGAPLAEEAYTALKRDIIRCRLRPGEPIIEAWLASEHGMSKTPIREAINLLRREGLVVVVPRRGTFVKSIDIGDVRDTYRLRLLLEPEAAVLAAQRASTEDLQHLDELSAATISEDADLTDINAANRLLHVGIAETARMPLMTPMIRSLHEEIERFFNLQGILSGSRYISVNHGRLVNTIRSGDEEQIRTVATEGIQRSRNYMTEAILADSPDGA